jgi:WD40 repeat protein/transcriptional regulator with XRE-family HTH domain
MDTIPVSTLVNSFSTFGDLLKYLRRRAHLTQLELSIAVGYSEAQISRLEKNLRLPDLTALKALFIPALHLEDDPQVTARFLELAQSARQEDAPAAGLSPYKGLLFFDEPDADLFFGREALTARLAEHVMDLAIDASSRFLAVVGASGSGKSSLMRAGLAVALKRAGWEVQVFTPAANPMAQLERILKSTSVRSAERTLILVDQFEELFTLCRDELERIAFVDTLLSCARDPSKSISVAIALRADFYSYCALYPLLRQAVAAEQEYIGQMTLEELRCAIEEPARRGGWEFEPGLVDILLQDVGAQGSQEPEPGALPLLSHALLATWERRRGRTLTLEGYRASGGVQSAIAETAESVFTDQLNQTQQDLARDVFLRLTELGEGTEDTRRRAALNELARQSGEAPQLRGVLDTLAEARLITLNEDSAEVSHEALIREWQRLRQWLTQDREGLLLHRHLTESAHDWERRGHDPADLYRGARLAQAREWAAANEERLNAVEQAFLAASIELEQHEVLEREAQRQRELEAAQKLAETQSRAAKQLRRRALILAGAFILSLILAGAAIFLGRQASQNALVAQQNAASAKSRELASAAITNLDDDPERSILLALQAEATAHTDEAENALHRSILSSRTRLILHHDEKVWSVVFSPDGKWIGTASQDKTARIWDASTGRLLLTLSGHTDSVNGIVFSRDEKRIATSSDDHTAKVWDATTGKELLTLSGHTNVVARIAFSPDGTRLATTSWDHTAIVWDAVTGKELFTLSDGDGTSYEDDIVYSPDGKRIAISGLDKNAGDGFVKVIDAMTGRELLSLPDEQATDPRGVAFSPDGTRLAVAGDGVFQVKVWDAGTGKVLLATNPFATGYPVDIAFSPDGKLAAASGEDFKAKVFNPVTGEVVLTLPGHTSGINAVAFSPDGTRLATASWDHTARVWDISPGNEALFIPRDVRVVERTTFSEFVPFFNIRYSPDGTRILSDYPAENASKLWDASSGKELLNLSGQAEYLDYSPDGKMVATSINKIITVLDAKTGIQLQTLVGHDDYIRSLNFSPDGKHLASASFDGKAIIWDLASGKAVFTLQDPGVQFFSVAYSPDGSHLFTGEGFAKGIIWDASSGEKVADFSLTEGQFGETLFAAAFSPDGKRLAVGNRLGLISIRDGSSGKELLTWRGHLGRVQAMKFSPDGNLIATVSEDGTVRVWDAATGLNVLNLPVDSGGTGDVAFSPDGKRLAVSGMSGIYLFVLPTDELVTLAKSHVTRSLTTEECQQYLHVPACPAQ